MIYLTKFYKKKIKNSSHIKILRICKRTINTLNCSQEGASFVTKHGAVEKTWAFFSKSRPYEKSEFKVYWKFCLSLCSRKWLRKGVLFVRNLIHLQCLQFSMISLHLLWQLKTLFGDSLINNNKLFKNTLRNSI